MAIALLEWKEAWRAIQAVLSVSQSGIRGSRIVSVHQSHSSVSVMTYRLGRRTLSGVRRIQQDLDSVSVAGHRLSSAKLAELQADAIRTMLEHSMRSAARDQRRGRSQSFDEICNDSHLAEELFNVRSTTLPYIDEDVASCNSLPPPNERGEQSQWLNGCHCRCHTFSSVFPIPDWLTPWIGTLYIPQALLSSLWSSVLDSCSEWTCQRSRTNLKIIKYFLPTWFAQVEASIRFEALPIHFYIRTPRVVKSLAFLNNISLDDFKQLLQTQRITIYDTASNGYSLVHVRVM